MALTRDDNTKVGIGAVDSVSGSLEDLIKDATSGGLHVDVQATTEAIPTDATKTNPSITITRNASNYITAIAQTISGTTYTKTITRDASNYITAISAWVAS